MTQHKLLFIFGTRPEAIKLCPLIQHFAEQPDFKPRVCVSAQHRQMLDQVLAIFKVKPDYDLRAMTPNQTLFQSTSRILGGLEEVLQREKPDMILVQGDTTTTFCGALAGFYAGVSVGHVEAGLRTGNIRHPFPEEMNRVLVGRLSTLHFAPTGQAATNLRREGVADESVVVTGNTGIDAVLQVKELLESGKLSSMLGSLPQGRKIILVTAHRRESFGEGFDRICTALLELSKREDVQIIYPVHPNPNVRDIVHLRLSGNERILLSEPLDYVAFVDLMRQSSLLLTDSGGIQEEGPSLGKPILVMRETTERPEAVEAGTVSLVGSDVRKIVDTASWLLDDADEYQRRARIHNPYGDGHASERIAARIRSYFAVRGPQ